MTPREALDQVIDLLFPMYCIGCRKSGGSVICYPCLIRLVSPLADEQGSRHRTEGTPGFNGFRAAGEYRGLLKEMILRLKSSRRPYAYPLARLMVIAAGNDPRYIAPDAVCFVPSSRKKILERGYNPAEMLARVYAAHIGVPLTRCIEMTRTTEDQDMLRSTERRANVASAFRVRNREVIGGSILLIDDVLTTGATAAACSTALLESGASEVNVLVAAHSVLRNPL